jgi:hypothetical protein
LADLDYEPTTSARPVWVEVDDGVTRVVVAMTGVYAPIPSWVAELDVAALVVAPILWLGSLLVRTCLRMPKPPRAVFEISATQFKMTLRAPAVTEITTLACPRSAVIEARANRYEHGLWLNVTGHTKSTYLNDLPTQTIQRLDEALRSALS